MRLLGESEIQTIVYCKENGITASIIPSKQGLADAIAGSCTSADRRPAPSAKFRFHGNEEQHWVVICPMGGSLGPVIGVAGYRTRT
jgi:hypothetical protein